MKSSTRHSSDHFVSNRSAGTAATQSAKYREAARNGVTEELFTPPCLVLGAPPAAIPSPAPKRPFPKTNSTDPCTTCPQSRRPSEWVDRQAEQVPAQPFGDAV